MNKFKVVTLVILLMAFFMPFLLKAQTVKVLISNDGSYDIIGKSVKITNCYPAFDNKSLKVTSVKISQNGDTKTIEYQLLKGKFFLKFGYQNSTLTINTQIEGLAEVPNLISIANNADFLGANKVYRTPVIIGGGAGIVNWPNKDAKPLKCESITGFIPDSGTTLVISTRDYKKYISHAVVYTNNLNSDKKKIDIGIETENVSTANIPTFYFTENTSAYIAMRNEAKAAADFMQAKIDKAQSYHWCSWYYTYYHLNQQMVFDYVKAFKDIKPSVNIQTFQIDAGYHPHIGDWLEPSSKFPNGIKSSVKEIIANGYKAGIWIGPYLVGNRSKLYAQQPDWILRKKDNTPIIQMKFYGEERLWGAMDEECYVLDTSNPLVMAYLRNVFREFKKIGITFFKTDFMYYGWESSNNVKRFMPGKTSSEYQRELFDMIRQEIGDESYWLGCIAPFPVMLGYVDGMRIAGDIGPKWEASTNMFNEMKGAQHINNIWWQNDADAIILRSQYSNLTDDETKTIAYWVGMLGGVINTSDLFNEIPKNRLELFKFLEPGTDKYSCYLPFISKNEKFEVLVKAYPDKKSFAILFVNRGNEKAMVNYTLKSLLGLNKVFCFEWDELKIKNIGFLENLNIDLNAHQSKLIYVSIDGNSPGKMTLGGKIN